MSSLLQPRQEIPRRARVLAGLAGFLLAFLGWCVLGAIYEGRGLGVLLPSPVRVWGAVLDYGGVGPRTEEKIRLARTELSNDAEITRKSAEIRQAARADAGTLWLDVRASFLRVSVAFGLAVLVGVPLGVLIGSFRLCESLLQPLTEFIRYVPVPALIPVLMILLGINEEPKIAVIFIGTVFQLLLMVADETRRVPYGLLQVCYTLGGTRAEAILKVLLPAALPGILDAMRLCNGWAWTWLIVAEMVAASEGLGFRIVRYQRYLQTDRIFVYLILLGLIGLAVDFAFRQINQFLFRWAETGRR